MIETKLFLTFALIALAVSVSASPLPTASEWRKVYDTMYFSGPGKVDWALDEPIWSTIERMDQFLSQKGIENVVPKEEFEFSVGITQKLDPQGECLKDYERRLNEIRELLVNHESRVHLYGGLDKVPPTLRFDQYIAEALDQMRAMCSTGQESLNSRVY